MKKKILKKALICALAVPCMFAATGCKDKVESIGMDEYTNLVYDAGSNYLRKHSDYKTYGDMSVSTTETSSAINKTTVSYKATASATEFSEKEVSITHKYTATQVIDVNRDETENGDIAIKVTKTSVDEEKGERANGETSLLENYEVKEERNIVYTFVKTGEEYKLFKHSKSTTKETGEDDETLEMKEVKIYASQSAFQSAIEDVLDELENDLIDDMLEAGGEMMYLGPDMYKGKDKFGLNLTYTYADQNNDEMYKSVMEQKLEYRDNLPYSYNLSSVRTGMNGENQESYQNMTITYSAPAISAPTDSADYTANNSLSHDSIITGAGF